MQGLKPRPGERRQQKVVQRDGSDDTESAGRMPCQPAVQEEEQVEEQERDAELDQDLGWDVPQKFPEQECFLRPLSDAGAAVEGTLPEGQIGQQGNGQKKGRDPTADVGDEGERLCLLGVRKSLSGQVLVQVGTHTL